MVRKKGFTSVGSKTVDKTDDQPQQTRPQTVRRIAAKRQSQKAPR